MPRATNSPASRRRRKRVLEQAKGYFGNKSKLYRYATDAVDHALQYAYRDRRAKKRDWRSLWIVRINAACRAQGMSYSRFIEGITAAGIKLDRRMLADYAARDEAAFNVLIAQSREALKGKAKPPVVDPTDLEQIEGVGAKVKRLLAVAGFKTFSDVAAASVDQLKQVVAAAGARFRMMDPTTWPEQAALAAKGDWDGLDALKAQLKGGRRV